MSVEGAVPSRRLRRQRRSSLPPWAFWVAVVVLGLLAIAAGWKVGTVYFG